MKSLLKLTTVFVSLLPICDDCYSSQTYSLNISNRGSVIIINIQDGQTINLLDTLVKNGRTVSTAIRVCDMISNCKCNIKNLILGAVLTKPSTPNPLPGKAMESISIQAPNGDDVTEKLVGVITAFDLLAYEDLLYERLTNNKRASTECDNLRRIVPLTTSPITLDVITNLTDFINGSNVEEQTFRGFMRLVFARYGKLL